MNYKFAYVLLPRKIGESLIYKCGEINLFSGDIVYVTLNGKKLWGVVEKLSNEIPSGLSEDKILPVISKIVSTPIFSEKMYTSFLKWVSYYYVYSFSMLTKNVVGPFIKENSKSKKRKKENNDLSKEDIILNEKQNEIKCKIIERWNNGDVKPVLLHGVTGSGKSEVYSVLASEVFKNGGQVLYLVPEIALTEGTLLHLEKRLGEKAVFIHSSMTPTQRNLNFWSAFNNEVKLIVGTRSAILYPFSNIKLIIVDEEHDGSYKNMEPPFYHARDCAVMRGYLQNIPVILGSATPDVASIYNTQTGKYYLEKMEKRANMRPLPPVKIFKYKEDGYIPSEIIEKVKENNETGMQALFFINRRGFATISMCSKCDEIEKCPHCKTALVFHKKEKSLICHHCLYRKDIGPCAECGSKDMHLSGMGIERLKEKLEEYFPYSQVESIDRDSLKNSKELSMALEKVRKGESKLIIGTVMISKGHNFPKLKTVIIKFADYLLNFSDYKAAEKCFQTINQVAGRAGRFDQSGEVFAEASKEDHYIWKYIKNNDYDGFANEELMWRKMMMFPPFTHLCTVRIISAKQEKTDRKADEVYSFLKKAFNNEKDISLFLPVEPPLSRINGKFRKIIAVNSVNMKTLLPVFHKLTCVADKTSGVTVTFDIDTIN